VQTAPPAEQKTVGMRLLKTGQKGLLRVIFSRLGLITALLLLQFALMFYVFYLLDGVAPYYTGVSIVIVLLVGLRLLNSESDPTTKITWLVIIGVLPVFGSLLYFYTELEIGHRALSARVQHCIDESSGLIEQDAAVMQRLREQDAGAAGLAAYAARSGCHPVVQNTAVRYFPTAEDKFAALLEELQKAEKFIFLEYFIVDEGEMWGSILEILAQKAAAGVEVRVMYDGTNEFSRLPHNYPQLMRALGIKTKLFSPARPFVSTHYNYRDHRKIAVIDGHTAFTGGVNLADEYINIFPKYGHWKDSAVMVKGDAARSLTLMFLQLWNVDEPKGEYAPYVSVPIGPQAGAAGFVMPYGDVPLDEDRVGEQVYIDLLYRAKQYVHIMSPYLILDANMETALKYAAQRGVEVKLMLPGMPDKWVAHALAKNHYASLVHAGVEVYEYSPGYLHSKEFIVDGTEAVVGTINLDYRSLYHHYECAVWMKDTPCIADIERNFQQTLLLCEQQTPQRIAATKWYIRLLGKFMKVFAPLL